MRVLPVRRLAASALGAALLLGVTAPAVLAADVGSAPERARSAAPVPGADAIRAQLKGLGDLGGVLKPVTELLDAVLKADDGRLSADRAAELGKAVRDAIDKARTSAPATPPAAVPPVVLPVAPPVDPPVTLPADPAPPVVPPAADAPTVPSAPSLPSVPAAPVVPAAPAAPVVPAAPAVPLVPAAPPAAQSAVTLPAFDREPMRSVAADPVSDALTALQTAVDSLIEAATSGDLAQVPPAVDGVVAGLVRFVGATLLGSGLPAPLAVPPVAPSAELPVTPATDTLPVRPPAAAPGR
ncbi:hypothetical protein [Streptomyces sp. VNUA24]|uniref:hypothetical protein n=1 Tax=Streptomyces sp. VNUA24 TaxID=3031131 RepID=UPI0023B77739|nr:hypothetical protein [Streptomyces sp. VNUA24]WEH17870.1 hypothetical protein PYR72_31030 [Streptomyces sp. VNUA24]